MNNYKATDEQWVELAPITPSPELVLQWATDWMSEDYCDFRTYIANCAAQWGADQELKACDKWVAEHVLSPEAAELRAARRPKPPTLNSIALQMLGTIERDAHYLPEITNTIRRALEALPND